MIIGVPKELKDNENRVAIIPAGVTALVRAGHQVLLEKSAGLNSGFTDQEYISSGAAILDSHAGIYTEADMVMKVKEPLPEEYRLFKPEQVLFAYLHLAPEPELTQALLESRVIGIAYETIELSDGTLPLLVPMSEVAGRMAVQIGATFLEKPRGGRGLLLGGVPGVPPADIVIVGGGIVGTNAAKIGVGMGAQVTILDICAKRLAYLDDLFGGRVKTVMSNAFSIARSVEYADLLIGAVLVPGARAPHLVTEAMIRSMKPGTVVVDVAIDQGGCIETIDRVTSHSHPTYAKHGVIHYAVPNIPAVVPRTSTFALTNVTLPYALAIANKGYRQAVREDVNLAKGVNTFGGKVTYGAVAESLKLAYVPLSEAMN